MNTIDYIDSPHKSNFKLEDFSCKRHRQPLGAVCGFDFCEGRLLCNDCVKEHDFTHLPDMVFGYSFSETYIIEKVNQFLRERIPIINHHERAKEKMKKTFKVAFDQFRVEILSLLDDFEHSITDMIDSSTNYTENYDRMKEHINSMINILDISSKDQDLENNNARHYLSEYKSLLEIIEDMKTNFNYEHLQVTITNHSNDFLKDLKQQFTEFRTSWTNSFGTYKPHDLGSFLKNKPKFLQGFNDRIMGITYSEQDRVLAALEGCYKIHFFSDIFDFNRQFFRLGFSKFEDYLSLVKWSENGSLILCNNSHKWVKLHYPSKTYSGETSTSPEGPIKKLGYFQELKLIIVMTEYWVICYQAGQTFMPVYYKIYSNGRVSDICLIKNANTSLVAVSTGSGYINVHDVVNRTEKYQFKAHNFGVVEMAYWSEQKMLISTGQQGDIKVWKTVGDRFRCVQRISYDYGMSLTNLILVPWTGWMIAVYNGKAFALYNVVKNMKIGLKKVEAQIVDPCYIKDAGKIVFGMDKALYQIKI